MIIELTKFQKIENKNNINVLIYDLERLYDNNHKILISKKYDLYGKSFNAKLLDSKYNLKAILIDVIVAIVSNFTFVNELKIGIPTYNNYLFSNNNIYYTYISIVDNHYELVIVELNKIDLRKKKINKIVNDI